MKPLEPAKKLMQQEMDRRQFLGIMGAATLAVTGVSGVIGGLSRLGGGPVSRGYGANPYGGNGSSLKRPRA